MADIRRETILTLFDSDSEEETFEGEEESELEESSFESKHIPINEAISSVPANFSEFLELLLPRLQPNLKLKNLSIEDQQSLATILVGELASQFVVIAHQINDPFLTPVMNKELHRSIYVEVAYILETLYHTYIMKACNLREDSVLNKSAQMSCLRAELIIIANKSLNIPLIRRKVIDRLTKRNTTSSYSTSDGMIHIVQQQQQPVLRKEESKHVTTVHHELQRINQIQLIIPELQLPELEDEQKTKHKRPPSMTTPYKEGDDTVNDSTIVESNTTVLQKNVRYKSQSYTGLNTNTFLSELGMKREQKDDFIECRKQFLNLFESPSLDTIQVTCKHTFGTNREENTLKNTPRLGDYTDEMLRNDVETLARGEFTVTSPLDKAESSEELNPLLAAYTSLKGPQKESLLQENEQTVPPSSLPLPSALPLISSPPLSPPPLSLSPLSHDEFWEHEQQEEEDKEVNSESIDHYSPILLPTQYSIDSKSMRDTEGFSSSGLEHSHFLTEEEEEERSTRLTTSQVLSHVSSLHTVLPSPNNDDISDNNIEKEEEEKEEKSSHSLSLSSLIPTPTTTDSSSDSGVASQPDVLTVTLNNSTVRASEVRVSQRLPLFSLRLQLFPTYYNELTDELNMEQVDQLDANLKEGQEIHEIYKELSETLSKDHLNFDKDPILQPCLDKNIKMSSIYASNSLHHRKSRRVINDFLIHAGIPPWKDKTRREWLAAEQIPVTPSHYQKGWKDRDIISVNDYLKFIANKGSDYLGVVHHMYDSDGSDSEDEQKEIEKKKEQERIRQELLAKEMRRLELLRQKNVYTRGQWNVNTVVMGGLGNDPDDVKKGPTDIDWTSVQGRLGKIWTVLQVAYEDQVTMTIKFSDPKFSFYIHKVLDIWESCCEAIKKRENALTKLETFERHASDPMRHFTKGTSSLTRLREGKQRSSLHKELDSHDKKIVTLEKSLANFDCKLTYKGRYYIEKMQMDRVELLYFLHQQRRQAVLKPAMKLLNNSS